MNLKSCGNNHAEMPDGAASGVSLSPLAPAVASVQRLEQSDAEWPLRTNCKKCPAGIDVSISAAMRQPAPLAALACLRACVSPTRSRTAMEVDRNRGCRGARPGLPASRLCAAKRPLLLSIKG